MSLTIPAPFSVVTRLAGKALAERDISLKRLRDTVAGMGTALPRAQAMRLLQESDFPNKHRDFERVLANAHEPPEARHLAALHLGLVGTPAAQAILVEQTDIPDDFVLAGVVKALGRIGNEAATLEAVERVQRRAGGIAVAQAAFATTLIAHRLGLEGRDQPAPGEDEYVQPLTRDAGSLRVGLADAGDAETCLRSLAHQPFGVEFAEQPMYEVRCGTNIWMIVFNRALVGRDALATLETRKTFLGVVAKLHRADGVYGAAFVILTSPSERAHDVSIRIHRVSGEVAIAGRARGDGDRAGFAVRSLAKPRGFSVQLEGTWTPSRLEITTASVTSRGEKLRPVREFRPVTPA